MNDFLFDTHVLLWWLENPRRLGAVAREFLFKPENRIFVSPVSVWEVKIKQAIGKLKVSDDFEKNIRQSSEFDELKVTWAHAFRVGKLPAIHADPFDRLLIAQAQEENLTLITADRKIRAYPVRCLDPLE